MNIATDNNGLKTYNTDVDARAALAGLGLDSKTIDQLVQRHGENAKTFTDTLTITFNVNNAGDNAFIIGQTDGPDGLGQRIADVLADAGITAGDVVVNL